MQECSLEWSVFRQQDVAATIVHCLNQLKSQLIYLWADTQMSTDSSLSKQSRCNLLQGFVGVFLISFEVNQAC